LRDEFKEKAARSGGNKIEVTALKQKVVRPWVKEEEQGRETPKGNASIKVTRAPGIKEGRSLN